MRVSVSTRRADEGGVLQLVVQAHWNRFPKRAHGEGSGPEGRCVPLARSRPRSAFVSVLSARLAREVDASTSEQSGVPSTFHGPRFKPRLLLGEPSRFRATRLGGIVKQRSDDVSRCVGEHCASS